MIRKKVFIFTKIIKLKIKREIKIGLLFIIVIAMLVWGINYLKGRDVFTIERIYYANYTSVSGLQVSNPVLLNGFKIGQVKEMKLSSNYNKVIVSISIQENIQIPKNSIARIYSENLLGSKAIELVLGNSTIFANPKDTLMADIQAGIGDEVNKQILPIKLKAEKLISSFDSVLIIIQSILNENSVENLRSGIENISLAMASLKNSLGVIDTTLTEHKQDLSKIINNVESFTTNLKKNNEKINKIVSNISGITDTISSLQLTQTLSNANKAMKNVTLLIEKVNNGEGSLGMLINNDTLYKNLNTSSEELKDLLKDIKLNPQRYVHISVFGRNPKKNKYTPTK